MDEPERPMQQWWSPIGDLVLCSQTKKYIAPDYGKPFTVSGILSVADHSASLCLQHRNGVPLPPMYRTKNFAAVLPYRLLRAFSVSE
jgi:hypothetical protein